MKSRKEEMQYGKKVLKEKRRGEKKANIERKQASKQEMKQVSK